MAETFFIFYASSVVLSGEDFLGNGVIGGGRDNLIGRDVLGGGVIFYFFCFISRFGWQIQFEWQRRFGWRRLFGGGVILIS